MSMKRSVLHMFQIFQYKVSNKSNEVLSLGTICLIDFRYIQYECQICTQHLTDYVQISK